ncbi:kynureninase [Spongiactinospora sp. TRM90649]|uniref:kynureninase n=1 Tax=Spongiactinospora sp. TRM90649 TaxID=3031114 RepID=UPI0023F8805A|nr:kynureninase [Spongiactinospora sp. TRM90649]MDF5758531.1 kynureninase [Spongiactinospora sp. TRM90649]
MPTTRDDCLAMDAADPLARFRDEFDLPGDRIYLAGNSLGAPPRTAADRVSRTVRAEWGGELVGGWNTAGWFELPFRTGDRIAPLIGADPGQVVVGNSTSVVIFQALAAALGLRPGRRVVVADPGEFPTDRYVAQGLAALLPGAEVRDGTHGGDDVAAVLLSQVHYRTGERRDVAEVTRRVQESGALMIWDLCHSVGALQVDVSAADFAVGCTYKYLNGGPGAPAFLYVNPRHHRAARNPLSGWYAHAEPFAFEPGFRPADGVRRFAVSTPHVLSFAGLEAALDIWERVDLAQVRAKSVAMTELFVELAEASCPDLSLVTPRDPERRGSQVSFRHPHGYPVVRALAERGVQGDFRAPDVLRFGFAPLYLRYQDVFDAVAVLAEVMAAEPWRDERYTRRLAVT